MRFKVKVKCEIRAEIVVDADSRQQAIERAHDGLYDDRIVDALGDPGGDFDITSVSAVDGTDVAS